MLSFFLLGTLAACALAQGRVAPDMPTEIMANVLQNKFNQNGFGVNHTCAGSYYSSFSQQQIRSDCTSFLCVDNFNASKPLPCSTSVMMSSLDFNTGLNVLKTYVNIAQSAPECYVGPLSWLPPFAASFLRDNNAVFAGAVLTAEFGPCDTWRVLLPDLGNLILTVFFDQRYGRFVRYDFQSFGGPQVNVGVTTLLFNVITGGPELIPPEVFAAPTACNATAAQAAFPGPGFFRFEL